MTEKKMTYPIGIQSFEEIRNGGYVYIDKTQYLWDLCHTGKYYFLSRPRRFGKSLFLSTAEAYFLGKRELFSGLAISSLEKEWKKYPVFHFDFNPQQYASIEELRENIRRQLTTFENAVGVTPYTSGSLSDRFLMLIQNTWEKTKCQSVILVDEYDKPLLNSVENKNLRKEIMDELKPFYGVVKSTDRFIKFTMFTGVARFSKVSVFSDLNNLLDISLTEDYNSICGISESELLDYFEVPIEEMARRYDTSVENMLQTLKRKYDGYNFSNPKFTECLYNPFSLLNCFYNKRIDDYWFDSGTPSFLIKVLIGDEQDLPALYDDIVVDADEMKGINNPENSPITALYQTGYLTVKAYDMRRNKYTIGFPNEEVANGFNKLAYQVYGSKEQGRFNISKFLDDVNSGNPEGFMRRLHALLATVPHEQAFYAEATYQNIIFLLFTLLKRDVHTEFHSDLGESDLVVKTDSYSYIFEFKFNKSVAKAMQQLNDRKYDTPWTTDDQEVFKIAVNYSLHDRNINWKIE